VPLLVVAQRDPQITKPGISDLYSVGTSAEVGRVLRLPDAAPPSSSKASSGFASWTSLTRNRICVFSGVPLYEDERHDMSSEALMRAVLRSSRKS